MSSPDYPAYRPDIDGLRGIAVLSVVAYHAFPMAVSGGYIGVDIFFVISGYLICSIILKGMEQNRFSFVDFYSRRIRRIFPALIIVLVTCLLVGWFSLLPDEYRAFGKHVFAAIFFLANVVSSFEVGYFDPRAELRPLLHLWSLGIEEQFYLFLPPALLVARWLRFNILYYLLALTLASFIGNVVWIHFDRSFTFFLPVTRGWELLIGCNLAWFTLHPVNPLSRFLANMTGNRFAVWRDRQIVRDLEAISGIGLIVVAVIVLRPDDPFPGWRALLPTLGAAILIAAGPKALVNRSVLANPAVVYIGLISYPLYLWHWPYFSLTRIVENGAPSAGERMLILVAAIISASLTYHLVEKPIRRSRDWRVAVALAGTAAVVAVLGIGTYLMQGFTYRNRNYSDFVTAIGEIRMDRQAAIRSPYCNYQWKEQAFADYRLGLGKCLSLAKDKPNVLVFGDSHAADVWVAFSSAYENVNFLQATGAGCTPSEVIAEIADPIDHCLKLIKYIKYDFPDLAKLDGIILSARWQQTFSLVKPDVDYYRALHIPVAVFGPTFEFTADVPRILLRTSADGHHDRIDRYLNLERVALDQRMERFFDTQKIPYVSKIGLLCPELLCPVVDAEGRLLMIDYGHWSRLGSMVFGTRLMNMRVLEDSLGINTLDSLASDR